MGSVDERSANVVDGGLAGFDVEGCGLEEDVGASGGEPGVRLSGRSRFLIRIRIGTSELVPFPARARVWGSGDLRLFAGESARAPFFRVEAVGVGDPPEAAGSNAGDAVRDPVLAAELMGAVGEQADERAVDVAESEEAEVEGADLVVLAAGPKPLTFSSIVRRAAARYVRAAGQPRAAVPTCSYRRTGRGRLSLVPTCL
jgi:hypothetical protein